jgi:hypothetical protein
MNTDVGENDRRGTSKGRSQYYRRQAIRSFPLLRDIQKLQPNFIEIVKTNQLYFYRIYVLVKDNDPMGADKLLCYIRQGDTGFLPESGERIELFETHKLRTNEDTMNVELTGPPSRYIVHDIEYSKPRADLARMTLGYF